MILPTIYINDLLLIIYDKKSKDWVFWFGFESYKSYFYLMKNQVAYKAF